MRRNQCIAAGAAPAFGFLKSSSVGTIAALISISRVNALLKLIATTCWVSSLLNQPKCPGLRVGGAVAAARQCPGKAGNPVVISRVAGVR